MNIWKRIIAVIVLSLGFGVGSLVPASPAEASLLYCSHNFYYNGGTALGAYARCQSGSLSYPSHYRVKVSCVDSATGFWYANYGPWRRPAEASIRWCDYGDTAVGHGIGYS